MATIAVVLVAALLLGVDFGLAVASGGIVGIVVSLMFIGWAYLRARSGSFR